MGGGSVTRRGGEGVQSSRKLGDEERIPPPKLTIRDRLPKSKALAMLAVWRWFGRFLIAELMPNKIQRLENGLNPAFWTVKKRLITPRKTPTFLEPFSYVEPLDLTRFQF